MAAVGESPCLSEQCVVPNTVVQDEEAAAESYLMGELESAQNRMCADIATALWNFEAELSQLTAPSLGETLQNYSAHAAQVWVNVARFNWASFTNSTLRRAFRKLSFMGKRALDEESLAKYLELEALLSSIRSNVTLCQYKGAWKDDDDGCHLTYSAFHSWYKAEEAKVNVLIRSVYKVALGLPESTSTHPLLQLGLHNTLNEIAEAQRTSQLQRLSGTKLDTRSWKVSASVTTPNKASKSLCQMPPDKR
ncbi:hypothetical protein HPB51_026162 [Rhipicephalus microplus]|uniref:Tick transposon n=1 Tax=Rhipicephalus microplus TaxID=6941 RepID=A0A9J6DRV1_RHIMP|nr:hypothetical protein HPB51_026162 [Rhipicephalus microplus]